MTKDIIERLNDRIYFSANVDPLDEGVDPLLVDARDEIKRLRVTDNVDRAEDTDTKAEREAQGFRKFALIYIAVAWVLMAAAVTYLGWR